MRLRSVCQWRLRTSAGRVLLPDRFGLRIERLVCCSTLSNPLARFAVVAHTLDLQRLCGSNNYICGGASSPGSQADGSPCYVDADCSTAVCGMDFTCGKKAGGFPCNSPAQCKSDVCSYDQPVGRRLSHESGICEFLPGGSACVTGSDCASASCTASICDFLQDGSPCYYGYQCASTFWSAAATYAQT